MPSLQESHTYKHRDSSGELDSTRLYDCKKFKDDLEVEDRVKMVLDNNGCVRCTSRSHTRDGCRSNILCIVCHNANHHTMLHGSTNARVNHFVARTAQIQVAAESKETVTIGGDEVLLQLQMVKFRGGEMGLVFFDN